MHELFVFAKFWGFWIYFRPTIWNHIWNSLSLNELKQLPELNKFFLVVSFIDRFELNQIIWELFAPWLKWIRIYALNARRLYGNVLNVRLWYFFVLSLSLIYFCLLSLSPKHTRTRSPISILFWSLTWKMTWKTVFNTCHATIINDRMKVKESKRDNIVLTTSVYRLQNAFW